MKNGEITNVITVVKNFPEKCIKKNMKEISIILCKIAGSIKYWPIILIFPLFLFQHYFRTFWKEIIFRVSTRLDQICVNENTAEKQIEEFFWQEDVSLYLKS